MWKIIFTSRPLPIGFVRANGNTMNPASPKYAADSGFAGEAADAGDLFCVRLGRRPLSGTCPADLIGPGHEIGCHSYWHQLVFRQTPELFREDLRRATETIGERSPGTMSLPTGLHVFRSPASPCGRWTFFWKRVIESTPASFPVRHDTYGIPEADPAPHVIHRSSGDIYEFPPAVRSKMFGNIPVAGGGYFRIFPTG
jgi:peptidoglycan/xylan/chitin deacetylase (PgdA/CDA1 family)